MFVTMTEKYNLQYFVLSPYVFLLPNVNRNVLLTRSKTIIHTLIVMTLGFHDKNRFPTPE